MKIECKQQQCKKQAIKPSFIKLTLTCHIYRVICQVLPATWALHNLLIVYYPSTLCQSLKCVHYFYVIHSPARQFSDASPNLETYNKAKQIRHFPLIIKQNFFFKCPELMIAPTVCSVEKMKMIFFLLSSLFWLSKSTRVYKEKYLDWSMQRGQEQPHS